MSERNDLTRWNRAGLTRFTYVDGNAVEYLETLRQQLVEQFAHPETKLCKWLNPAENIPANEEKADNETLIQRQQRLGRRRERILDTYHQDRRDWVWEISRTFARACHILTEHTNAYTNEGYLGTATQWDNVRRLVEMLDYHPAPPASASTKLVLEAKESKSGLVKKGWQVKYKPPEGGDKVVFETLDDIQVHHELNGLRLDGFDKSPDHMGVVGGDGSAKWNWVTEDNGGIEELELSAGNVAVLVNTPFGEVDQAIAVTVEQVDNENNNIWVSGVSDDAKSWEKGESKLLVSPKDILTPRLNGDDVAQFYQPHGLSEGDVIAWNSAGTWRFDQVIKSDALSVKLQVANPMPTPDMDIFKSLRIPRPPEPGSKFMFPYYFATAFKRSGNGFFALIIENSDYQRITVEDDLENSVPSHSEISKSEISEIFLVPSSSTSVGQVELQRPVENIIDGGPGDLASGQWVVAENGSGEYFSWKISSITEYEDHFAITFKEQSAATGGTEAAERLVESLKKEIRKLQPALDETAMAEITLGHFMRGEVADRDAVYIQGVGTRYINKLKGSGTEFTIAQLAEIEPSSLEIGISNVRLNEFKTNAERVLRFQCDAEIFERLSGKALTELLEGSTEELAGLINTGDGQAPVSADVGALRRLYGPFEHTLYPEGHDRNNDDIMTKGEYLELAADTSAEALALLKPGHLLILEREDGSGDPVSIEAKQVTTEESGEKRMHLSRKLKEDEVFTKGNLIIRGNVVLAGHGEGKPEKILGSGDAMLSNQSFTLEVEGVAFTADATKSSGVAAAMDVSVDGQIWEQVSTLKDSTPGDHHYAVYAIRMTEEGYVRIIFGDGQYGRRLPSGKNNIRVRYRVGSGLSGNVPVGGLEKPVSPHPLIKAVRQPLPAAGGGDMEDMASLRENAPSTLLALERAVSLSDFSHLAAAQSSVWQAKAYSQILHGGRTESVKVVIVPADGVQSPEIRKAIRSFLQKHALPGVQVTVGPFVEKRFSLSITVRVKTDEFIAEEVEKAVASALVDHFTLKNRKLGEHLYLSEVYKIVEGIKGVENSKCDIFEQPSESDVSKGKKALQVIKADDESTVVYLDTDADENPSTLTVTIEEYLP